MDNRFGEVPKITLKNPLSPVRSVAKTRSSLAITLAFVTLVLTFSFLLTMPFSQANQEAGLSFSQSFFTVASAMSGTGLTVVQTGTFFSFQGKFIIMLAMQIGGIGVVTFAFMLSLAISHRLGLASKLLAVSDFHLSDFSSSRRIVKYVVGIVLVVQTISAAMMFPYFYGRNLSFWNSVWHSWFYAVSAFNNAGFDLTDNDFPLLASHPGMSLAFIFAITMGAIGFPTIMNVFDAIRKRRKNLLSLNTKIVLVVSFSMDAVIILWHIIFEWGNRSLFEPAIYNNPIRHFSGLLFAAMTARASGFSVIDVGNLSEQTRLIDQVWMFVGAAPVSTCAGIRVTTFAVLILAVLAEIRGNKEIVIFKRRPPASALRVAIVVFSVSLLICVVTALYVESTDPQISMDAAMFDTISAYTNCGNSLGVPPILGNFGLFLYSLVMLAGRIGPMTIAAALMKKERTSAVRFPEENVILG